MPLWGIDVLGSPRNSEYRVGQLPSVRRNRAHKRRSEVGARPPQHMGGRMSVNYRDVLYGEIEAFDSLDANTG